MLEDAQTRLEEGPAVLTAAQLMERRIDFSLHQKIRETLPVWIEHVDPEPGKDIVDLQRRLDRAFEHGFYETRFDGDAYYNELHQFLCSVGSETMARWHDWQVY